MESNPAIHINFPSERSFFFERGDIEGMLMNDDEAPIFEDLATLLTEEFGDVRFERQQLAGDVAIQFVIGGSAVGVAAVQALPGILEAWFHRHSGHTFYVSVGDRSILVKDRPFTAEEASELTDKLLSNAELPRRGEDEL